MNNTNPKGAIKMKTMYSRFRMRIRIAAISLLMVFFSQQVSWACAGNLSLLVNLPPSSLIYQDHGEFNRLVANRVYSLAKPSFRHKPEDLKSAYQWLKQPATETVPCSAYVLFNLLRAKGIKPKIEDIAASLISLDLKAGNLKPPFTGSRVNNSLYAMAKTAEIWGLKLTPARLLMRPLSVSFAPFIAHLNYSGPLDSGHFVLVTKIDAQKAHFFYDKGNTFLPTEKFLQEFSGYALIEGLSPRGTDPKMSAAVPLSEAEAQSVLGARSVKSGPNKINWSKWATQTGIMIGSSVVMSGVRFGGQAKGTILKDGTPLKEGTGVFANGTHRWGKIGYQMPNMNIMGRGLMRAATSYTINRLVLSVGKKAELKPGTIKIISSVGSFAALSGLGDMNGTFGGLGTWRRVGVGAMGGLASSGLTEAISPYKPGKSQSAFASLAGMGAGILTMTAMTGALGGYNKEGIIKMYPEGIPKGIPDGGFSPGQWAKAAWEIGVMQNRGKFAGNFLRVGVEEVFGRDSAFNKMVGNAGNIGSAFDRDGWGGLAPALLSGVAMGGLSVLAAKMEKRTPFKNPFAEAFAVNTLSAGITGAIEGVITKDAGRIFERIQDSWQENGMAATTFEWSSRQNNVWGNFNYMNNLQNTMSNMADTSFAEGFVQYATDVYHYGSVSNLMGAAQYFRPTAYITGQDLKKYLPQTGKFTSVPWKDIRKNTASPVSSGPTSQYKSQYDNPTPPSLGALVKGSPIEQYDSIEGQGPTSQYKSQYDNPTPSSLGTQLKGSPTEQYDSIEGQGHTSQYNSRYDNETPSSLGTLVKGSPTEQYHSVTDQDIIMKEMKEIKNDSEKILLDPNVDPQVKQQDLDRKNNDFYDLQNKSMGMSDKEVRKERIKRVFEEETNNLKTQLTIKEGMGEKILNWFGLRVPNKEKAVLLEKYEAFMFLQEKRKEDINKKSQQDNRINESFAFPDDPAIPVRAGQPKGSPIEQYDSIEGQGYTSQDNRINESFAFPGDPAIPVRAGQQKGFPIEQYHGGDGDYLGDTLEAPKKYKFSPYQGAILAGPGLRAEEYYEDGLSYFRIKDETGQIRAKYMPFISDKISKHVERTRWAGKEHSILTTIDSQGRQNEFRYYPDGGIIKHIDGESSSQDVTIPNPPIITTSRKDWEKANPSLNYYKGQHRVNDSRAGRE